MANILLVDDEDLIISSLSKTLRHAGYEVTAAMSGRNALRLAREHAYDICFLDVQLPDTNGLEIMNVLRKVSPRTAIVIMTGVVLDEKQLRSISACGCRHLPKPFDLGQVQHLIEEIAGNSQAAS